MKRFLTIAFFLLSISSFSQTIPVKQVIGAVSTADTANKWVNNVFSRHDSLFYKIGNIELFVLKFFAINIEDYGAVGDNSTDNSAILATIVSTGLPFYIPGNGKTFRFSTGITLQAGQKIFGYGKRSQLRYTGTTRAITVGDSSIVEGFQLIGNGKSSGNAFETGVFAYQRINWVIKDMFIVNFGGNVGANGGGGIDAASINPANSEGGKYH